jgi:hypothetical protein
MSRDFGLFKASETAYIIERLGVLDYNKSGQLFINDQIRGFLL